jgi:hypothetical protein
LREPGTRGDLAGADAVFQGVRLVGEIGLGVFQPVQSVASQWVSQGLEHVINVDLHGGIASVLYRPIAMKRTLYRSLTLYRSFITIVIIGGADV